MSAKLHLRDKYTERQKDKRACQLRPFCLFVSYAEFDTKNVK